MTAVMAASFRFNAARLQELMDQKGLSQSALAKAIGIRQASVSGWLLGKNIPGLDAAATIARYFKISVDELVIFENDAPEE